MLANESERLRADLHRVVEDVELLLAGAAHETGEAVGEARERAGSRLREIRARLAAMESAAAVRVREAARAGDAYVHRNPWAVAGAAAAAAFALGMLVRR